MNGDNKNDKTKQAHDQQYELLKAYDIFKSIKATGAFSYEARFNMVACHMKLGMWLPAHYRLNKLKQKAQGDIED